MATKYDTELRDFPSLFSLKGKVVVVTGGSRGLGLSAASGYVLLSGSLEIGTLVTNTSSNMQLPPSWSIQSLHHIAQSRSLRRGRQGTQFPSQSSPRRKGYLCSCRQLEVRRCGAVGEGCQQDDRPCGHTVCKRRCYMGRAFRLAPRCRLCQSNGLER